MRRAEVAQWSSTEQAFTASINIKSLIGSNFRPTLPFHGENTIEQKLIRAVSEEHLLAKQMLVSPMRFQKLIQLYIAMAFRKNMISTRKSCCSSRCPVTYAAYCYVRDVVTSGRSTLTTQSARTSVLTSLITQQL